MGEIKRKPRVGRHLPCVPWTALVSRGRRVGRMAGPSHRLQSALDLRFSWGAWINGNRFGTGQILQNGKRKDPHTKQRVLQLQGLRQNVADGDQLLSEGQMSV